MRGYKAGIREIERVESEKIIKGKKKGHPEYRINGEIIVTDSKGERYMT